MNNYNPNIHHRRSVRLQGYDYSQAGLYFITICTHNRECLFGTIANGQMMLNHVGKIANECWIEIPTHFPNAVLHEYVIMPNHVHGIIELTKDVANVGAENFLPLQNDTGITVGAENFLPVQENFLPVQEDFLPLQENFLPLHPKQNTFQKMIPRSIGSIVKGFKIGVTKWFRNNTVGAENFLPLQTVWQRNYHEHIIRNEQSYQTISEYIIHNPLNWRDDKFYNQ